ncbi:MAG: branched-chain amino acid ABC transporter permease [Thermodesulfobacteriota bacterium]
MERALAIILPGLMIGGIYALIAVGLNLMYGTMRMLNVAHGELIMMGAYVAYWLFTLYKVSPLVSIILIMAISCGLGLVLCRVIFLPIINSSKSPEVLESSSLLIFFGISIILSGSAALMWTADIRGYSYLTQIIELGNVPLTVNRLTAFLVAIAVSLATFLLLNKTMFGKAIRALIQDRDASQLVGVNPNRVYMFSFGISFALAGLAGGLISMFYEINPYIGLPYTITAFIIIVLGGLGNIMGSLLAGFILGLVETVGISLTSPGLRAIISYAFFIAIILLRPRGIFGKGG